MGLWGYRRSFLLAKGPDIDFQGEDEFPVAIGYDITSEIYSYDTQEWRDYKNTTSSWYNEANCLVQDLSDSEHPIYYISDKIEKLHVKTCTIEVIDEVDEKLENPGRCALTTIDGQRGIFLRDGNFYELDTKRWINKTPPPLDDEADKPNSMWSYQGRPTIFGSPVCDPHTNECLDKEVIQYNPENDKWKSLGHMLRPRNFHEVVEVDGTICDYFVSPVIET